MYDFCKLQQLNLDPSSVGQLGSLLKLTSCVDVKFNVIIKMEQGSKIKCIKDQKAYESMLKMESKVTENKSIF